MMLSASASSISSSVNAERNFVRDIRMGSSSSRGGWRRGRHIEGGAANRWIEHHLRDLGFNDPAIGKFRLDRNLYHPEPGGFRGGRRINLPLQVLVVLLAERRVAAGAELRVADDDFREFRLAAQ